MIKFLDLKKQLASIENEIHQAINGVLESSSFIGGQYLERFESEFAAYQCVKGCLGVGNGTDALEIALEALNLPPGSEVIVPANTFIATAEAVTRSGHKVVFCDVNPGDYTLDISDLEARITPQTSAVMAVHLYGHPCDMDEILRVTTPHNIKIIEDSAQAHGAEYKGKKIGGLGDVSTFSFYPGKNLGAYGDGGAILSNDLDLLDRCRRIANHGRKSKYDHAFEGRNSRLDGLQAAILSVKLKHLDNWTQNKIDVADFYTDSIKHTEITIPVRQPNVKHVYHLYVIRTPRRDELAKHLNEQGIQTGIHYPISLPKLEAYEYLGQANSQQFGWVCGESLLSLPVGDQLTLDEAKVVAAAVNEFR